MIKNHVRILETKSELVRCVITETTENQAIEVGDEMFFSILVEKEVIKLTSLKQWGTGTFNIQKTSKKRFQVTISLCIRDCNSCPRSTRFATMA